ncbi:MAG: hypothetical protein J6Y32_07110 [Bacteroidales bacterium]|nr:hypothetical protein [Bacteroidales bacterium]
MKKSYIYPLIAVLSMLIVNSCLCSGSYSSKWDNDPEYWRSVNRENQLRKAGMDNAADMEKNKD